MKSYPFWYRALIFVVVLALFTPAYLSSVRAAPNTAPPEPVATGDPDAPQPRPAGKTPIKPRFPTQLEQEVEGSALDRDWAFYSRRTAGDPNVAFSMQDAATLRAAAADQLGVLGASNRPQKPGAFGGAWTTAGPNPMVLTSRGDRTFDAMTGRIGALAIRSTSPYTIYLGGAQGGIWISSTATSAWTPKTDFMGSLAIGAIALAPSNEDIVYVGTGEGALSGDSYFGEGVYKSSNGGGTFAKISAAGFFTATSISKLVVDNMNPDTLFAGTLRGRGGARRTSPPTAAMPFGVWKSTDGGVSWTAVYTASTNALALSGVTDLVMDPQNSNVVYASVLGSGIVKTVDGGLTWQTAMNGLPPSANYATAPSRIALGISHPATMTNATLYAGFEYYSGMTKVASSVFKSTDNADNWSQTSTAVVNNYCGSQCTYDNVIDVDPTDPGTVYVLGLYNYSSGSGGIFRSRDGGATWVDLGFNLHPDYHAIAIRKDNPSNLVIGNDGGVWSSSSQGGRLNPGDPLNATTWVNLNGTVNPATAVVTNRSGLALGQFTSIATNPAIANRFYGGTQDNGTLRKSTGNATWYDVASGDGGQVLLDPTDANYMYGEYYGISPYRFSDGGGLYSGGYTSNEFIDSGINANDRSEFYVPWIMDPANPARLYYGTYRVYRTDNAKAAKSADVYWNTISTDLTSGCTGAAPNGGRGCYITAFGKSAGSNALYVGTEEGWIWLATDSTVSSPTWSRLDNVGVTTPNRPIASIAVDASNYRVAYVGFNGFSAATPSQPGHIFKTNNGGQSWTDISNNLPDIPVNSIVLDPSDPQTIYLGTDIGPFVSYNGGGSWAPLGSGFPVVAIWQLTLNPFTRQIAAGTHGRGAWSLTDNATMLPALQIAKQSDPTPLGPGSTLLYTLTVSNRGNVTATNVVITDPIPANTTFVNAGGGTLDGSNVVFTVPTVPPPAVVSTGGSLGVGVVPGTASVTFTVQIAGGGVVTTGSTITNDGYYATSAQVPPIYGSPNIVTLAPASAVAMQPQSQFDGTRSGQSLLYALTVRNLGFAADTFALSSTGNAWPITFWDGTASTQISNTPLIGAGGTATVFAKVAIPGGAANGSTDVATVKATSNASPSVFTTAVLTTTAVTYDILLVDGDDASPNVESFYQIALTSKGYNYNYWDLRTAPGNVLPPNYLKAHKAVVWFTGMSYPGPLLPYESELAAYLDGGGRIFMSGQDILDQSAGTTPFVLDYLHINWDGTEVHNDQKTVTVTSIITSPFTSGLALTTMDYGAAGLSADYSDQITPTFPAEVAFLDDKGQPDALQVDAGVYKVIFLAFPFEAMQNASNRATVLDRGIKYLMANNAVTSVAVSGPPAVGVNQSASFTATVAPITATRPVRYYWQATGQTPVVHLGLSSDTNAYAWPAGGPKVITVTASNEDIWANLSGTHQVPPVNTAATGLAAFVYDPTTRVLSYTLTVNNLVGPTAAHIHLGAAGVNGAIAYTLATPVSGTSSGAVTLNASDEPALYSAGLYVNVHTAANPGGEVRGQIMVTGGHSAQVFQLAVAQRLLYLPIIQR